MQRIPLTRQQKKLFGFLKKACEKGSVPSLREMGKFMGYAKDSTHGIIQLLEAIEKKGWIERGEKRKARQTRIV